MSLFRIDKNKKPTFAPSKMYNFNSLRMGQKNKEKVILFCDGKKCCKYNSEVKACFKDLVQEAGLNNLVTIQKMKCQGFCKSAPIICIHKNECVGNVSTQDARKLFAKHIA